MYSCKNSSLIVIYEKDVLKINLFISYFCKLDFENNLDCIVNFDFFEFSDIFHRIYMIVPTEMLTKTF